MTVSKMFDRYPKEVLDFLETARNTEITLSISLENHKGAPPELTRLSSLISPEFSFSDMLVKALPMLIEAACSIDNLCLCDAFIG